MLYAFCSDCHRACRWRVCSPQSICIALPMDTRLGSVSSESNTKSHQYVRVLKNVVILVTLWQGTSACWRIKCTGMRVSTQHSGILLKLHCVFTTVYCANSVLRCVTPSPQSKTRRRASLWGKYVPHCISHPSSFSHTQIESFPNIHSTVRTQHWHLDNPITA